MIMFYVIFISCFFISHVFLLDSKTQPPPTVGSLMTDDHYQFVMQFIFQERQSRLQLEKYVKQLQQELVTTKTHLTTEINGLKQCGCASDIKNKTSILLYNFDILKQDHDALKIEHVNLQKELIGTNNRLILIVNELSLLKQLKIVSDLKVVFDLQNKTNHLEQEIQATNSRQQAINSEASARKQDFLALYQKVQTSEIEIQSNNQSLQNQTKQMEGRILEVNEKCDNKSKQISRGLSTRRSSMQNRITALSTKLNGQIINIQREQKETANKEGLHVVAFYAYLSTNRANPSFRHTLIYDVAKTNSGNGYNAVTGIFTAPTAGIYVFTWFTRMYEAAYSTELMVNNAVFGTSFLRISHHHDVSVSGTVVTKISKGDSVFVRVHSTNGGWGEIYSDKYGRSSFAGWLLH